VLGAGGRKENLEEWNIGIMEKEGIRTEEERKLRVAGYKLEMKS
jgi:hypothetical protein